MNKKPESATEYAPELSKRRPSAIRKSQQRARDWSIASDRRGSAADKGWDQKGVELAEMNRKSRTQILAKQASNPAGEESPISAKPVTEEGESSDEEENTSSIRESRKSRPEFANRLDVEPHCCEKIFDRLPEGTIPVLKGSVVPFVIFLGAFFVAAVGITGSILSVDTAAGNMMNITAQLATQEVRYTAAEYAFKAELSAKIFSDLEYTSDQMVGLAEYAKEGDMRGDSVERHWTGLRAYLGKLVAEDDKLLWLDVWDFDTGTVFGASSLMDHDSEWPTVYDYMMECARFCKASAWTDCCEGEDSPSQTFAAYNWSPLSSIDGQPKHEESPSKYALKRELIRASALGNVSFNRVIEETDLWAETHHMSDLFSSNGGKKRIPKSTAFQPYWRIISEGEIKKLPMASAEGTVKQVALVSVPFLSSKNSTGCLKVATAAVDATLFVEKVMAAVSVSGVGESELMRISGAGYSLEDGGCLGIVELTNDEVVGADRSRQDEVEKNAWKHENVLPEASGESSPRYQPINLCGAGKLAKYSKESQRTLDSYYSSQPSEFIETEKFGKVLPGSVSYWPIEDDDNPTGALPSSYYRNPWRSDSSAGDAVVGFHTQSLQGWPVSKGENGMSVQDNMKSSSESSLPASNLGGLTEEVQLFLPNWGVFVGTPRVRVIAYLKPQMTAAILLTLLVIALSVIMILHMRLKKYSKSEEPQYRLMQFLQRFVKPSESRTSDKPEGVANTGPKEKAYTLGGLHAHSIFVIILTFTLTMFLTFISSSTWGSATDDISFRAAQCASTVASRNLNYNAWFRQFSLQAATDIRNIHFMSSQEQDLDDDAFAMKLRNAREAYRTDVFSSFDDGSDPLGAVVSVPEVLLESQMMQASTALSLLEVLSSLLHVGVNTEAMGSTVWGDTDKSGYVAVQSVALDVNDLQLRAEINPFVNFSRIEEAWGAELLGSFSILVRQGFREEEDQYVEEYLMYPELKKLSVEYNDEDGTDRTMSVYSLVSNHKSLLDISSDVTALSLVVPAVTTAIEASDSDETVQSTMNEFEKSIEGRTERIGRTRVSLDVSLLQWFTTFNHFSSKTQDATAGEVCPSLGFLSTVAEPPAVQVTKTLFSSTWTMIYSFWSVEEESDTTGSIATGSEERRSFTAGTRGMSLVRGSSQIQPTNATRIIWSFKNFILDNWLNEKGYARPPIVHSDGSTKGLQPLENISMVIISHVDMSLGALSETFGQIPLHFSTKTPFDNTSPFEIGVDDFNQPHRLIANEGPLRAMHSVDADQVSLPRLLAFSTALYPDLAEELSLSGDNSETEGVVLPLQRSVCDSQRCVTNFPERRSSQSQLFTGEKESGNDFEVVIRPAGIIAGASHGGVLQVDFENGGFERIFTRESDDLFVSRSALAVAASIDFFQYGKNATSILQNVVQLRGLESDDARETSEIGVGVTGGLVHNRHVVGGASGVGMVLRKCLGRSDVHDTEMSDSFDGLFGSLLSSSLRNGDEFDLMASAILHRQTMKRESDSWQWALFLINLGPLLVCTLFAGFYTTVLRDEYHMQRKKKEEIFRRKTLAIRIANTNPEETKADQDRRPEKKVRKIRTASILLRGQTNMMHSDHSQSHSVIPHQYRASAMELDNESEPLLPPDPVIENTMKKIHGPVKAIYQRGCLWDAWQQDFISQRMKSLNQTRTSCSTRMKAYIERLWVAPADSNHVSNPLCGLKVSAQNDGEAKLESQSNPIKTRSRQSVVLKSEPDKRWQASIYRRAREFLHMYKSDRHALEAVLLDRDRKFVAEKIHWIYSTPWYTWFVYITVFALISLAFFEASDTVIGGSADNTDVIVSPPEGDRHYSRVLPEDSVDAGDDDIEVEIGVAFDDEERLPHERSVDGREGWSINHKSAMRSFSATSAVEEVEKLRSRIMLVEFFILLILGFDNTLFYLTKGMRKFFFQLFEEKKETQNETSGAKTRKQPFSAGIGTTSGGNHDQPSTISGGVHTSPGLGGEKRAPWRKLYVLRCVLWGAMLLDFFVRTGVDYRTGRSASLLPLSVLVRPLYAIIRMPPLRRSIQSLFSTILLARRTFTLFIVFTIVIAAISIALWSDYTDLGENPDMPGGSDPIDELPFAEDDEAVGVGERSEFVRFAAQREQVAVTGSNPAVEADEVEDFAMPGLARGFTNFQASWYTMFILAATGENYDDIAYPDRDPADDGGFLGNFFRPYMVVLALLGMFIMAALLLVSFQTRYTECFEVRRKRLVHRRRFAPLVAFALLDLDGNGFIDRPEYFSFFKRCGVKQRHYEDLNDKLSATEFVYVCEYLSGRL